MRHSFRALLLCLPAMVALHACPAEAASQAMQLQNTGAADVGYVSIANQAALQSQHFTVEMWIRPLGPGYGLTLDAAGAALFAKPEQGANGGGPLSYHMGWDPVTSQLDFLLVHAPPNVYVDCPSSGHAPQAVWTHVAFSFDGSLMRIFINGVADTSKVFPYAGVYYGNEPILIGAGNYGSGYLRRFEGDIADVRLWSYARSDSEITAEMNCSLTGHEAGLVANWKLDGNLLDATALHADGVVTGSISYVSPTPENCVLAVAGDAGPAVRGLELTANPNPFHGRVNLVLELPAPGRVAVEVFDLLGTRVARLANESVGAGRHAYSWNGNAADGRKCRAGLYWIRAAANGQRTTRVVALVK